MRGQDVARMGTSREGARMAAARAVARTGTSREVARRAARRGLIRSRRRQAVAGRRQLPEPHNLARMMKREWRPSRQASKRWAAAIAALNHPLVGAAPISS